MTRSALARDLARLHTGAPGGWPALQLARLALIVAALTLCGGPRGRLARRRRRGPEGLRAAGGAPARNVPQSGLPGDGRGAAPRPGQRILRAAPAKIGGQPMPGALRAPLKP